MAVLSQQDVTSFMERGHCTLYGAFDAQRARAVRALVWERMRAKAGIREADPASWPEAYDIQEVLDDEHVRACFPDRLAQAVAELVGQERWQGERRWGFWPVNFRTGAAEEYRIPDYGWHVDGNWFRHTLDCPHQGLLLIGLFSDIEPRGGGTIVAEGSHWRTARVLAAHPAGLTHHELFDAVLAEPLGNFHELTGAVGDVILAHPFLFHTRGHKHVGPPRFISNTEAGLRGPLQPWAPRATLSPLERSIVDALQHPLPTLREPMLCRF